MTDEGPPEAARGGPAPRPEDSPTGQYLKIFFACLAIGIAAGISLMLLRQLLLKPAPSLDPFRPPPGLEPSEGTPVDYRFFHMGGIRLEIKLWERDLKLFMGDTEECEKLIEAIDREVSIWRRESPVSRLNEAEAGESVEFPAHAFELMLAAVKLHELSRGAFNPALGPAIEIWREAIRRGEEPRPEDLEAIRGLCTPAAFELAPDGKTVRKLVAGARLDLSGIAPGYVVDRLAELLWGRGARLGLVTAGNDMKVLGGTLSRVATIGHPEKKGTAYGCFYLQAGAASTANDRERFQGAGEKTRGRVFDPRTLRPVEGVLSATVIASDCTTANGLATAVFVLGAAEGLRLADLLPEVEALILVRDNAAIRQVRTRGFPEVKDISDEEVPFPGDEEEPIGGSGG